MPRMSRSVSAFMSGSAAECVWLGRERYTAGVGVEEGTFSSIFVVCGRI